MKQSFEADIVRFELHLRNEERSKATIEKYLRDVRRFQIFAENREITKELIVQYKDSLIEKGYAVRSINSMLAALNTYLSFLGCSEYRVRSIKAQKTIYCREERLLTKAEYLRLLDASRNRPRLFLLLQTICATGIRVSELSHFTVEAVKQGEVIVHSKGKTRVILVPSKLKTMLLKYARQLKIERGVIFRTKSGLPLDRSNIWTEMKHICGIANVNPSKVFPHNLRKLFARTFYNIERDIAKLADILGHSSIDTTRIYIMSTGWEHQRKIDRLG